MEMPVKIRRKQVRDTKNTLVYEMLFTLCRLVVAGV